MAKGYFFSLEALIAALILIGAVIFIPSEIHVQSDKEAKIYRAMNILEANGSLGSLSDSELKANLSGILGFDVEVNPPSIDGPFIKYLMAEGPDNFRIIRIAYQQP
jgi:hypothetical protein